MPFVIPRVCIPLGVNCTNATSHQSYTPEPTIDELEKYEAWLCEELVVIREAILVAKFGASMPEVVTSEPLVEKTT